MHAPSFGSSGIRGPFGEMITPDLALRLGAAVAEGADRILVGGDFRVTGGLLRGAFAAGALAAGAEVTEGGCAPTPALAYSGRRYDAVCVVTASHNPAPDNGFKLWNPDGAAFDITQRTAIETALLGAPRLAAWDAVGERRMDTTVIAKHMGAVLDHVGTLDKRLRVVLDCGNGAACPESPFLLRELGCDVITLNAQPDGRFPGRPSEPNAKNIRELSEMVRVTGADLGLAHDGDADRCMAVDETGTPLAGDVLLALLARKYGKTRVAAPLDSSMVLDDAAKDAGIKVVKTKVGDAFVSETLKEQGGEFGGESSGAWIFPEVSYCPDGPLAAALFCRMVQDEGPLSKQAASLPTYHTVREARAVANERKDEVIARVADTLAKHGEVNALDGVRVDLDGGWVLVRASGTEPKVRVTAEARESARMQEYLRLGLDALDAASGA